METESNSRRVHKLQQIPVFALREQLYELLREPDRALKIKSRIVETLNIQSQNPAGTIKYLNREQLIQLISVSPEIDDLRVDALFEEYRYGTNPSFSIYVFDPGLIDRPGRIQMQGEVWAIVAEWNRKVLQEFPRVRKLSIDAFYEITDHPEIIEANYNFQKRLDYIDEDQNPTSTYETLYGFFWINTRDGYVIIQARDNEIQRVLELAISEGSGIHMVSLVITKELKNALSFLLEGSLRSSRLHDPDPETTRFRWLSITDDDPYAKGYRDWEQSYPEIRNARYRVEVGNKETSLTIRFDSGAMSLAGKLTATQFRNWSLTQLSEIIQKVRDFHKRPVVYIQTYGFRNVSELQKYSAAQKDYITHWIALLLDLKQNPGIGYRDTNISPMQAAYEMKRYVFVQYLVKCEDESCDREGYYACEVCGKTTFDVVPDDSKWALECREHRKQRWSTGVPIEGVCEQGHKFTITLGDLEHNLQILPSDELLGSIAAVVNQYIPDFVFSDQIESFMLRGSLLYYVSDRAKVPDPHRGNVTIINKLNVGRIEPGGKVTGVHIGTINDGAKG